MKVTVNSNNKEEPVAMVSTIGDLYIKTSDGKIFLLKTDGFGDHLENMDFYSEVKRYRGITGTKLIYPGDKITIEF